MAESSYCHFSVFGCLNINMPGICTVHVDVADAAFEKGELLIYPNPVSDAPISVSLPYKTTAGIVVEIIDFSGKAVLY